MVQMSPAPTFFYKEDPLIRKLRVQAWFWAVKDASNLSAHELERMFRDDTGKKTNRSCIWNKYRRGEVVPRRGLRPGGGVNLVDRVEESYPGTAEWLVLPLWRLLDKAPMEMSEIRRCYESLPPLLRGMFIRPDAKNSSVFWRLNKLDCKKDGELLLRFGNLDGLTGVLTMLAESITTQNQPQHVLCVPIVEEYFRRMAKDPVIGHVRLKLTARGYRG